MTGSPESPRVKSPPWEPWPRLGRAVLVLTVVFSRQCSRWWCWLSIKEVPFVMCCSSSVDPWTATERGGNKTKPGVKTEQTEAAVPAGAGTGLKRTISAVSSQVFLLSGSSLRSFLKDFACSPRWTQI